MTREELLSLADEIEKADRRRLKYKLTDRFYEAVVMPGKFSQFTTNLQDAIDAVPEGWAWYVSKTESPRGGMIFNARVDPNAHFKFHDHGEAPNPAAALCAAILRAKAAERESE